MVKENAEKVTRLKAYQRLLGLPLDEMGAALGVTGVAFGRYVSGRRVPKRKVADRLKEVTFGVLHAGNYAEEVSPVEAAEMMAEISRRAAAAGEAAHG